MIDTSWIWSETQILIAADASAGDYFGISAVIINNVIVIGASQAENTHGNSAGAVYIFAEKSANHWTQLQSIEASGGDVSDSFGILVGVYNDTIVVGASGDDDQGTNAGIGAPPVI